MQMALFLSIMYKLSETSSYFSERYDTTDRTDLIALLHMLTMRHRLVSQSFFKGRHI
jgi:hypothetical protein